MNHRTSNGGNRRNTGEFSRRALLKGVGGSAAVATALGAPVRALAAKPRVGVSGDSSLTSRVVNVSISTLNGSRPISPMVYGVNEDGLRDGVPATVVDKAVGVAARRLGGNRFTGYNWKTNHSNAGKDHFQSSDNYVPMYLGVPTSEWEIPARAVSYFHETTRDIGATSLVTVPIAGYVAADANGVVETWEVAPSARWKATSIYNSNDSSVVSMEEFVRLLVDRHGPSDSSNGIRAYSLDNEPGLWWDSHPRLHPEKARYDEVISQSIETARMIKEIDPGALVHGPVSYGFSEMFDLQTAPDRDNYSSYGTFLGAYLAAMKEASDEAGIRLLDVLDIHWYPSSDNGQIPFTDTLSLLNERLQAPRSLWDDSYTEPSWIGRWYGPSSNQPLKLPLLPCIQGIIDTYFPGTAIGMTEFNYGDSKIVEAGLAVADVLGVVGHFGVQSAYHWWRLENFIGCAYQLYRNYDGAGGKFGDMTAEASYEETDAISVWASTSSADGKLHFVAINKTADPLDVAISALSDRVYLYANSWGFTGDSTSLVQGEAIKLEGSNFTVSLPGHSATHYVLG